MPIASNLLHLLQSGVRRLGELEFQANVCNAPLLLYHWQDSERLAAAGLAGLERHDGPAAARELSLLTADGEYRFSKAQTNLKRGWVLVLQDAEELRQALDQFYPAAVGLYLAAQDGSLEIENLRDKLERQTGMYRFARNISDAGAQRLIQQICGPAHQCAKRILWQIDGDTPLDDSEASRFAGITDQQPAAAAIPLLCREACNHFVAECRKAAKDEAKPSA